MHAGLEHPTDPVSLEDADEAGDVVLVRVRQHDDVDPPIPGRDPRVELEQQAVRVRPAVDEHPGAVARLEQDRVPLTDVQHDEPGRPQGRVADRERREHDQEARPGEREALRERPARDAS